MKTAEQNRSWFFKGSLRISIVPMLVAALIAGSLPQRAKAEWKDQSGSLPGTTSGKTIAIGAGAGGAALVAVILLLKKKKGHQVKSDTALAGQPNTFSVSKKAGFGLDPGKDGPFVVSPGEKFERPLPDQAQ